jgi:hypothetical protein
LNSELLYFDVTAGYGSFFVKVGTAIIGIQHSLVALNTCMYTVTSAGLPCHHGAWAIDDGVS